MTKNTQTYEFQAQVSQLLELLTHSIYSNKEIFLRELISNANDAIDKARIKSLTNTDYLGEDVDFKITIDFDNEKSLIIISDNGIGMTKQELIDNIGTIAKSGTKEFLDKFKEKAQNNNLIGQFGVGFYSVFMVAEKVELETKSNESDNSIIWISEGKGVFEIKEGTKKSRGTTIKIYLKESEKHFADDNKLRELIIKYSNYLPIKIMMKQPLDKDDLNKIRSYETVNETKSIWTKSKNELNKKDYEDFYSNISMDFNKPLSYLHLDIEGIINYKALIYIPHKKNMFDNNQNELYGPKLYVQNVLILENSNELIPSWLRFIKGVVETNDLPLNISREILQDNIHINKIKSNITKNILNKLEQISIENESEYIEFLENYGIILKEGVYFDFENKEKIAGLLRFYSIKNSKYISFDNYINEKNNDQNDIFYMTGMSIDDMKNSPYLSSFKQNNIDVLLMTHPIDEYIVNSLIKYKNHELKSVMSDNIEFGETKEDKEKIEKIIGENKDFLEYVKTIIGNKNIEEVKLSNKFKDSLGVLITKKGSPSAQMEKIMKAMNQPIFDNKRIFELNIDNEIVKAMQKEYQTNPNSEKLNDLILYSYEQALLNEGQGVEDLNAFLNRLNKFAKEYIK